MNKVIRVGSLVRPFVGAPQALRVWGTPAGSSWRRVREVQHVTGDDPRTEASVMIETDGGASAKMCWFNVNDLQVKE